MHATAESNVCLARRPSASPVVECWTTREAEYAPPWSVVEVPPDRSAWDAQVERSEEVFRQRLAKARREDERTSADSDEARNSGEVSELQQRWWRRPIRYAQLAKAPEILLSAPEVWGCSVDGFIREENEESSSSRDGVQLTSRDHRQRTLEIACHRLSLSKLRCYRRFFAPICAEQLAGLPAEVVEDILAIVHRCDRGVVRSVRPVLHALRAACEPLERYEVDQITPAKYRRRRQRAGAGRPRSTADQTPNFGPSSPATDINLRYGGREYCLLRSARDYSAQDVSNDSGRAIGCRVTLLPETHEALVAEIARFQARQRTQVRSGKGHSVPEQDLDLSVRRFTRPNPFYPAPEDGRSVAECFFRRRRTTLTTRSAEERRVRSILARIRTTHGRLRLTSRCPVADLDLLQDHGYGRWVAAATPDGSHREFVLHAWL